MPRDINLAELLTRILQQNAEELRVALPGEIVSYDASLQEADVKILVKRHVRNAQDDRDADEIPEEFPVIPSVPVIHPRGGGFHASFPLAEGDPVTVLFHDFSLDDVRDDQGIIAPSDRAVHHLTNATCFPGGVVTDANVLGDSDGTNFVVGEDGGNRLVIAPGGPIQLGTQSGSEEFIALADKVESNLNEIRNKFNAHVHVETGGTTDAVIAAQRIAAISSVAAANAKAD